MPISLNRSVLLFVLSEKFTWSFNWESFFCFFILLIFLLLYEFRRNNYLLWSQRAVFICKHPSVACLNLIFLVWWLLLVWMPAMSFLSVCGHYLLDRGCDWWCGDQCLHWILYGASSLLGGCHSSVRGRVCSLVVGVEDPRFISKLQCEVGCIGVLPAGRGAAEYSSSGAVH